MSPEIANLYPSPESTPSRPLPEAKPVMSKVEQLNRTLQRLRELDAKNSKIDSLKKQFERGDQLGKQAEPFYQAVLAEHSQNFGYTIQRAPESLDYFNPHIDYVMLFFNNENMMGIQLYSPTGQYNIQEMAAKMIGKYMPAIHWGIRPLPGLPEKTFGPAPIGFVTPQLNRDTINRITSWRPGQPIDNTKKLASDFFNLLARSVDPDVRERFLKVSFSDPKSQIPKRLAAQALVNNDRQRLTLSSYSRSLERLSRSLQS